MSHAKVLFFREANGEIPLYAFLDGRKERERARIVAAIERLKEMGHRLRPPHTEHLGDRLYYLRVKVEDGTCRIFYWPHGEHIMILGHGFGKKSDRCPPREIEKAREMRERFRSNPAVHSFEGGDDDDSD